MPTTRPEASRRPCPLPLLVGTVVGLLTLSACALLPGDEPKLPGARSTGAAVAPRIAQVLRARQRAVLAGDRAAWLATVPPGSARMQGWRFDNLVQLPLAALRQRVLPATVAQAGRGWRAVVVTTMRLDGYDAAPVTRRSRYRFVRGARGPRGSGLLVAADRDPAWERRNDVERQPWDLGPVQVVRGERVLGVFDADSAGNGDEVIAAVDEAIDAVSAHVPHPWSRSVVVYALSDTGMLDDLDGLPAADPDRLDAIAFPVTSTDGGDRLAGMRFVLHPRMLAADADTLARLIRHELTHVALGARDDEVPLWLSEGLAEWVSVQAVPRDRRLISGAALAAARQGPTRLPTDTLFNQDASGSDYGLAWWACEAIADMYGADALWDLLDAFAAAPSSNHAVVLRRRLHITEAELAGEAARRILATYG
jgi:hypothetical protein